MNADVQVSSASSSAQCALASSGQGPAHAAATPSSTAAKSCSSAAWDRPRTSARTLAGMPVAGSLVATDTRPGEKGEMEQVGWCHMHRLCDAVLFCIDVEMSLDLKRLKNVRMSN